MRHLLAWLRIKDLQPVAVKDDAIDTAEDPRVVIDLYRTDGTRDTYYASRFNLISEDNKRKRPIDDAFREKFRFRLAK